MKRPTYPMFVALLLVAFPAATSGEEPEDAFRRVYGEAYEKAKASRDTADDVTLAAQLVKDANAKDVSPGLATVFCDKAYELVAKVPAGQTAAAEAMRLLAEKAPDRKAACLEKVAEIRQKQYDAMRGPPSAARATAGEALIDALMEAAEAKAEVAEATAAALGRRAVTLANALKSPRKSEVVALTGELATRLRLEKQAADLKAKISATPPDPAARQELVRLLVVDLGDPMRAAAFVDESCEEAMRTYVPGAAKGIDAAPDAACKELADWYRSLADTAVPPSKPAMLVRAWQYYERYLRIHNQEDLARAEAAQAIKSVEETLEKVAPVRWEKTVGPGRWIDLLQLVDPTKSIGPGKWEVAQAGVVGTGPTGNNFGPRIPLPVAPSGSYEVSVRFVRIGGSDYVAFILPVGSSGLAVMLSNKGGSESILADVRPRPVIMSPGSLDKDREYELHVKVFATESQGEVDVCLNGRPYLRWQGAQSDIRVPTNDIWNVKLPDDRIPGLAVLHCQVLFKSAKIRMISGKARILK